MTQVEKDRLQHMISVMQAFVEGKEIEFLDQTGRWMIVNHPTWNWQEIIYRIKSEPKYRPFESAEEVMEAIKEHGDWVKRNCRYYHIKDFDRYEISVDLEILPFERAFKILIFADGTPFGKLIEE